MSIESGGSGEQGKVNKTAGEHTVTPGASVGAGPVNEGGLMRAPQPGRELYGIPAQSSRLLSGSGDQSSEGEGKKGTLYDRHAADILKKRQEGKQLLDITDDLNESGHPISHRSISNIIAKLRAQGVDVPNPPHTPSSQRGTESETPTSERSTGQREHVSDPEDPINKNILSRRSGETLDDLSKRIFVPKRTISRRAKNMAEQGVEVPGYDLGAAKGNDKN